MNPPSTVVAAISTVIALLSLLVAYHSFRGSSSKSQREEIYKTVQDAIKIGILQARLEIFKEIEEKFVSIHSCEQITGRDRDKLVQINTDIDGNHDSLKTRIASLEVRHRADMLALQNWRTKLVSVLTSVLTFCYYAVEKHPTLHQNIEDALKSLRALE
jgi:hypothetical protein